MGQAKSTILLVGCAAALAACSLPRVTLEQLNPPPRALQPRAPGSVEVFVTTKPARPYVEVAILEAEEGTKGPGGGPTLVRMLRERAARLGCDAIMLAGWGSRIKVQGNTYDVSIFTRNTVRCTCIVYRETPATTPPAPAPSPPRRAEPKGPQGESSARPPAP